MAPAMMTMEPLCATCAMFWVCATVWRVENDIGSLRHNLEKLVAQGARPSAVAMSVAVTEAFSTDAVRQCE